MTPLRCAIVGYGISGACFHAPILRDLDAFDIVAVVSSRPDDVHGDLGAVPVYPDLATLLAASDAEVCVIASLNEAHASLARACLEAGRHVVVEKPFVLDPADGRRLADLARSKGLTLAVYHSRRWDGDFLTLKRLVADGSIGRPHTLISHYDRWRPVVQDRWRERPGPGAGILWDLGSHLIDQALELLGPARSVFAEVAANRPGASVTDHFHLVLDHGGATSILHGDCLTAEMGPRFLLHGDRGSFIKYGMDGQETFLRAKRGPRSPGWGIEAEETRGRLYVATTGGIGDGRAIATERGSYEGFYMDFARAIREGKPSPVTADAATDVVDVILAAERSAAEGRRVPVGTADGQI